MCVRDKFVRTGSHKLLNFIIVVWLYTNVYVW